MSKSNPIPRKYMEESIRSELESTVQERVDRFLEIQWPFVIPYTHFSHAFGECLLTFRDGHFCACIVLTQAVAEAMIKFLCKKNHWRPSKDYEQNVYKLCDRSIITTESKDCLIKVWKKRDDYHHLNPDVMTDREELYKIARQHLTQLLYVVKEVFHFTVSKDGIVPTQPKYWS